MTPAEIGQRIAERRSELELTLQDVADRVHVARSTIQRYESGSINQLKLPVLFAIAQALRVNPDWLIGKSEYKELAPDAVYGYDNILPLPRMNSVPLIGTIACGTPILAEENVEDIVDMPEHVRADFALRCRGDSMINARIFDGDIVYIRQQPTVEDGDIAAVLIGDEATLKRFHRRGDTVVLQAENPDFPMMIYAGDELETIRILGKAVAFTSNVR